MLNTDYVEFDYFCGAILHITKLFSIMVHTIYIYDSSVGTSSEVRLQFPLEDLKSFDNALGDFKSSLVWLLSNIRYLFVKPVSDDNVDLGYYNLVVDCDSSFRGCLVDFVIAFFKLRGFIG